MLGKHWHAQKSSNVKIFQWRQQTDDGIILSGQEGAMKPAVSNSV